MTKRLLLFALSALLSLPAAAQFSKDGDEPHRLRWSSIETPAYRLVYPSGMDSLARSFAVSLEKYRIPVAGTCGFVPNETYYRGKFPVVLHANTSYTNGSVAWAPRRMALFAVPDAYNPEALDWVDMLTSHESRHVAQMQFGRSTPLFRFMGSMLGEMWAGAAVGMYFGPTMLEGDAVAAETGLLPAGRGRSADFLEYMRVSLSQGIHRDFWQWSYGSQKRYTPDYYRAGYMLVAGIRHTCDRADFIPYYTHRIQNKGLPLFNLQKSVKELSGEKFRDSFDHIQDDFAAAWAENDEARGPFAEGREVTGKPRLYEEFYSLCPAGGKMFALRRGLDRSPELVELLPDGSVKRLRHFSGTTSRLAWSGADKRLYWSEYRTDTRWGAVSYSNICYRDSLGVSHTITHGKRYYNPAPHPESGIVAVTEYPSGGGSAVVILSGRGSVLQTIPAPDGVQAVETVWLDGRLYATSISAEGSCVHSLPSWRPVMEPLKAKINHIFARGGRIWFTSDLDGVNELYSLELSNESLWRETSTRFGGNNYVFAGDSLYFTSPGVDARGIRVLPEDALLGEEAPDLHAYPVAETLTEQETIRPDDEMEVEISEPEPYYKFAHALHFHSWAPAFIDMDIVSAYSYERTTMSANVGAMAFFQNELSNNYGYVGVGLLDAGLRFRPSAHLQYAYTGFYPVFEFRLDVNDRGNVKHAIDYNEKEKAYVPADLPLGGANIAGSVVSYIPINLSSGGWTRGVIPMVKLAASSDSFGFLDLSEDPVTRHRYIRNITMHPGIFADAEVRAYTMLPTASSQIYPRLGLGMKTGVSLQPFRSVYYGNRMYASLYGYLPGLMRTHGLHLNLDGSRSFGSKFATVNAVGLQADYAMPFLPLDWSGISPLAYLRNFEFMAHADLSGVFTEYKDADKTTTSELMQKVGASLIVRLGNLLWIPYDTRIGARYIYCISKPELSAWSAVFSIDI